MGLRAWFRSWARTGTTSGTARGPAGGTPSDAADAEHDAIRDAVYTLEDYQRACGATAVFPSRGEPAAISYLALGLCGESGEVAEKVKKVLRDSGGVIDDEVRRLLILELGDILWYVSEMATHLDVSMGRVARINNAKLHDRRRRGVLGGSGDER